MSQVCAKINGGRSLAYAAFLIDYGDDLSHNPWRILIYGNYILKAAL
jgi:hypothetical protein